MKINEIITEKNQRTNEVWNNIPVIGGVSRAVSGLANIAQGNIGKGLRDIGKGALVTLAPGPGTALAAADDARQTYQDGGSATDAVIAGLGNAPGAVGNAANAIGVGKGINKVLNKNNSNKTAMKTKKVPSKNYDQATQDAGL